MADAVHRRRASWRIEARRIRGAPQTGIGLRCFRRSGPEQSGEHLTGSAPEMPVADRAISTGGELTVRCPRVMTHEGT